MASRLKVLKLYKNIYKAHRNMPVEIQQLGDMYLRVEFKRHKSCDPKFIPEFMKQWEDYYDSIKHAQDHNKPVGKKLSEQVVENQLSNVQLEQLLDLGLEATKTSQSTFITTIDDDGNEVPFKGIEDLQKKR